MEDRKLKIAFSGPSGTGKTTLAKWLAEEEGLPFISSSMSDLIPDSKELPQYQLVRESSWESLLMFARHKRYQAYAEGFVTDRSFIDGITYYTYKLGINNTEASPISSQASEEFIDKSLEYLLEDFDYIFILPMDYRKPWEVEDNNKRNTNRIFQWGIGHMMTSTTRELLSSMNGPEYYFSKIRDIKGVSLGDAHYSSIWQRGTNERLLVVTYIHSMDLEKRKQIIKSVLSHD